MGENFKTYTYDNKGGWAKGGRISGQGTAVVAGAWMAVSGAYALAEMVVNGIGGAGGIMMTVDGATAVLASSPPAAVPSLGLAKAVLGAVYGSAVCANEAASLGDVLKGSKPGRKTKGRSKQFEKSGGSDQAQKGFDSMKPSGVRDIGNGGRTARVLDDNYTAPAWGNVVDVRQQLCAGRTQHSSKPSYGKLV